MDLLPLRRKGFSSPFAAQFWAEWRMRGWIMPAVTAAAVVVVMIVVIILCLVEGSGDIFSTILKAPVAILLLLIPYLSFLVGGFLGGRYGKSEMEVFYASRPCSDRGLAGAKLGVGALSILVSWAIAWCAVLPSWLALVFINYPQPAVTNWAAAFAPTGLLNSLMQRPTLAVVLSLLLSWTLLSLTAVMGMLGHRSAFVKWAWGGVAWFFIGLMLTRSMIPPAIWSAVFRGGMIALGAGFLFASIAGIIASRFRNLAPTSMLLAGLAGWIAMAALGYWSWVTVKPSFFAPLVITWIGFLTLAAGTPALGALAVAKSRHR